MLAIPKHKMIWLLLLLAVVVSNTALYNTTLYELLAVEQNPQVVAGSLLDLIVVAPILALLLVKKFSWKRAVAFIAAGCVLSRFVIPNTLLQPYKLVTTAGITVELLIIAAELVCLGLFLVYVPKMIRQVKRSNEPLQFAWETATKNASKQPIIQVLASELLVFYYAFASWRAPKQAGITLYKKSSYIAFQMMLLHGIVLESIGLHWWLHSYAPVLSIILLLLNVYGVIFLLADLRAMQLQPIQLEARGFYMTQGMMKRTYIDYADIESIERNVEVKPYKKCVAFIAPEFTAPPAQLMLKMKQPQTVHMLYGIQKQYDYVAVTCDDPQALVAAIEEGKDI